VFPTDMPPQATSDPEFQIGHVLFIDIVGYSKLLIGEQSERIRQLKEVVAGSEQVRLAQEADQLISLPTGDGVALVFRDSPETAAQCALEIAQLVKKYPELQLRMGIHSGPVNLVKDVNNRTNVAGAGINIAQRVMDCGDAGHILVSKHVAEDLEHYARWQRHLHDFGEYEVKHGLRLVLVNLYTDELGNPQIPSKVATPKKATTASRPKIADLSKLRPTAAIPRLIIPVLATAVVIIGLLLIARYALTFRSVLGSGSSATTLYASKAYEKAKWSKIYGIDRLLPQRAAFQQLAGWDRNILALTGTIEDQQLLVLLQNGQWKMNKLEGHGPLLASRFASDKRLVLVRLARGGVSDLVSWENGTYQWLGNVPSRTSLFALGPNTFCGMEDRGVYWKYSGNGVQQFDRTKQDSFVRRDKDAVAQIAIGNRSPEPMAITNVRDVTRLSDGKALGLWSTPQGACAVVRYEDDHWYLANEIPGFTWNNVPNKIWFIDEKDFAAIGSDKVTRCVKGKVEFQALSLAGQEYSARELIAVWGHNLNSYWVADLRGNIFQFGNGKWKQSAHGPDLKANRKLEALWPAPDGSVIAITTEDVYALE
jgi:Adenylate and Guanylate cyclase catalytic domain